MRTLEEMIADEWNEVAVRENQVIALRATTELKVSTIKSAAQLRVDRWTREIEVIRVKVKTLEDKAEKLRKTPKQPRAIKQLVWDAIDAMTWLTPDERNELSREENFRAQAGREPNPMFSGGTDPLCREFTEPGFRARREKGEV